jgi:hypothetical protein
MIITKDLFLDKHSICKAIGLLYNQSLCRLQHAPVGQKKNTATSTLSRDHELSRETLTTKDLRKVQSVVLTAPS